MGRKLKVLISGYYGFGNTGDEAVLAGLLKALRAAADVEVEATVLSADPDQTRAIHGVRAIRRTGVSGLFRVVRESDLFISGGGGLLQDTTSWRSPYYYLGLIHMAKRCDTPVYLFGQGMGPVESRLTRWTTGRILSQTAGIGVRDEISARWLQEIGVPDHLIQVTADAAFALDRPIGGAPLSGESAPALRASDTAAPGSRQIGIVWRSFVQAFSKEVHHLVTEQTARVVTRVAREIGCEVTLFPFHPHVDMLPVRELQKVIEKHDGAVTVHIADHDLSAASRKPLWQRNMDQLAKMDAVLAVRFHGLVYATLTGVPVVSISYDPKVWALTDALGIEGFSPPDVKVDPMVAALTDALRQREELSSKLLRAAKQARQLVFAEGERALAVVKEGRP